MTDNKLPSTERGTSGPFSTCNGVNSCHQGIVRVRNSRNALSDGGILGRTDHLELCVDDVVTLVESISNRIDAATSR